MYFTFSSQMLSKYMYLNIRVINSSFIFVKLTNFPLQMRDFNLIGQQSNQLSFLDKINISLKPGHSIPGSILTHKEQMYMSDLTLMQSAWISEGTALLWRTHWILEALRRNSLELSWISSAEDITETSLGDLEIDDREVEPLGDFLG